MGSSQAATQRMPVTSFDHLYRRDHIDAVLHRLLPRELCDRRVRDLGCNGFLTADHLRRIQAAIEGYAGRPFRVLQNALLVELGCGNGGLSRWLSTISGARVIGIDISRLAIARARRSNASTMSPARPLFRVADFRATTLPDEVATAVVSWDALYLTEEPAAAVREVRRILKPGAGLFFSVYVSQRRYPGTPPLLSDWRPLLTANGFKVEHCLDATEEWRRIMRMKHERRWARRAWLRRALGQAAEPELAVSAAMLGLDGRPSFLERVQRIELSARRR